MIIEKEHSFKLTSLGPLPYNWCVSRIGDITAINAKSIDPTKKMPDSEFLYIDIDSIENGLNIIKSPKRILGKNAPSRARRVILQNDVLMSTVRPYLKAFALVPKEYDGQICSTGLAVLTCKRQLLPYYLLITLFSAKTIDQCNRMMVGGQYPAINGSQVANITIPVPPVIEQEALVKIFSVIYSLLQKTIDTISVIETLRKGLMFKLLTCGLHHKSFKITELGEIPSNWQVIKLGELLELCQYGLSVKITDTGTYKIVKMDDILDGLISGGQLKYTDITPDLFERFKLKKGDILFNRTNSYELVGKTGLFVLDGNYTFASYLIRLRVKKEIVTPQFLTYYLIFAKDRIQQIATKAVHQANINATNLKNFKIAVPPLEEQKKYSAIISLFDKRLRLERLEKQQLETIKEGLLELLLSGNMRAKMK